MNDPKRADAVDKMVELIIDYLKSQFPKSDKVETRRAFFEYQARMILPGLLITLEKEC